MTSLFLAGVCLLAARFLSPTIWMDVRERITGNTPEARVRAYVSAALRGDEDTALRLWELPTWDHSHLSDLTDRRQAVTRELIGAELQKDFLILHTEWWGTCCEPGVVCDPHDAGGARMSVQFLDQEGLPVTYIFDVFHRGGSYWGGAAGYPPRDWVLRDVYPRGDDPLFWRWVYKAQVRYLK